MTPGCKGKGGVPPFGDPAGPPSSLLQSVTGLGYAGKHHTDDAGTLRRPYLPIYLIPSDSVMCAASSASLPQVVAQSPQRVRPTFGPVVFGPRKAVKKPAPNPTGQDFSNGVGNNDDS